ncbi:GNAT family N-acetyltransferase [Streptomyces sp. BI20]|uniref:GNAT family N-acetyltransferase n=1 Tax=Streptomyces sp. BI20 TaxID=3403460 RepID=UPI003C74C6CC
MTASHPAPTPAPVPAAPEIRTLVEHELPAWLTALNTGFQMRPTVTDSDVAQRAKQDDLTRDQGAWDPVTGRIVATFRSFTQELTVPGGARITSSAISNVTVHSTHRRRGLLSRMMAAELAAARERGDAVATLIAAEHPIYGRYGFGPATSLVDWEVDVHRTGLDRSRPAATEPGARIDLVDPAEVRRVGPELHERLRAVTPGAVNRDARWWDLATGVQEMSFRPYPHPFFAVYTGPDGRVDGLVSYTVGDTWSDAKMPGNTLTVRDLIALTPGAERGLWHHLCTMDWIGAVRTGSRAPDDLLPDLLPDPRAARTVTAADGLWLRVLDVPAALSARTYAAAGTLVLTVTDAAGIAHGTWRLEVPEAGGRGTCVPVAPGEEEEAGAGLRLDVSELSARYLGEGSFTRAVALGRVEELRPGAAAWADLAFRTARRPWCPDMF